MTGQNFVKPHWRRRVRVSTRRRLVNAEKYRKAGLGDVRKRAHVRGVRSKRALSQRVKANASIWTVGVVADLDLDETLDRITPRVWSHFAGVRQRQRHGRHDDDKWDHSYK